MTNTGRSVLVTALLLAAIAGTAGATTSRAVRSGTLDPGLTLTAVRDDGVRLERSGPATESGGGMHADGAARIARGMHPAGATDAAPVLDATKGSILEPGNWAMLLAGLIGVGAIARRRTSSL